MHIVAHRGWHARAPENSVAAVHAAIEAGIDRIEVDVRLTRDGVPVVMHDGSLARTTTSALLVHDLPASMIPAVRLGDGSPLPRLEEVIDLCRGRAVLCADLKVAEAAAPTIDLARAMSCEFEIWSTHRAAIAHAADRGAFPAWISHGVMPAEGPEALADEGMQLGARAISFFPADLDSDVAEACHRFGLEVMSGTPNDRGTWEQLMDLGARAIITDRPAEARDWLTARTTTQTCHQPV